MRSHKLVIDLNKEDRAAVRCKVRSYNIRKSFVVRTCFFEESRVHIRCGVEARTVDPACKNFGVFIEDPFGNTAVNKLGINVRSGTDDNRKVELFAELQKSRKVTLGTVAELNISFSFFMNYPRNVCRNAVSVHFFELNEPRFPVFVRNAEIVKLARNKKTLFTVE